jgi:hypothetical protein
MPRALCGVGLKVLDYPSLCDDIKEAAEVWQMNNPMDRDFDKTDPMDRAFLLEELLRVHMPALQLAAEIAVTPPELVQQPSSGQMRSIEDAACHYGELVLVCEIASRRIGRRCKGINNATLFRLISDLRARADRNEHRELGTGGGAP